MAVDIRPATADDLATLCAIWYEAESAASAFHPPVPPVVPAFYRYELETGDMYVVERNHHILGFISLLTRDFVCYIAEFFVRPDCQSAKIGGELLHQVLPRDGRTICTLSSQDFRALSLYVRAGLRPWWPNFQLRACPDDLGELPEHGMEVVEADPNDPDLVAWDERISGRHRPQDLDYLTRELQSIPLWFRRNHQIVGYGYAQMRTPGSLWFPDAVTLGPIGALNAQDAAACAYAAVEWARTRTTMLRIPVPGPHLILRALLHAGFRITYVETFLTTTNDRLPDPSCYIPTIAFF